MFTALRRNLGEPRLVVGGKALVEGRLLHQHLVLHVGVVGVDWDSCGVEGVGVHGGCVLGLEIRVHSFSGYHALLNSLLLLGEDVFDGLL